MLIYASKQENGWLTQTPAQGAVPFDPWRAAPLQSLRPYRADSPTVSCPHRRPHSSRKKRFRRGTWLRIKVRRRDKPRDAASQLNGPLFLVYQVMVMRAEQRSVAGPGASAAGPIVDVVGLAPRRRDSALGKGAAPVPRRDGLADVRREDPRRAADVEDPAFSAQHNRDDVGVEAILRTVEAVIGPVNISVPALEPGSRDSASAPPSRSSRSR